MSIRRGKTTQCSIDVPIWTFANDPTAGVAVVSYGLDLAVKSGIEVRDTIHEQRDTLGFDVRWDRSKQQFWQTTEGGWMGSYGVGGPIEGEGFSTIILDDLLKNPEEANSDTIREKTWEWYQNLVGRLNPNGNILLTMAPWHWDDPTGRIMQEMERGGEQWDVVRMPAQAEDDDWLGRKNGEWLWPERYSPVEMERIKTNTDAWTWASRYQCRPSPSKGAIWSESMFRYYTVREGFYELGPHRFPVGGCWRFLLADLALTEKKFSSYTCMTAWDVAVLDGVPHGILVDVWRAQMQAPDIKRKLWEFYAAHPNRRWFGIERKHYGLAYCQELRREGMLLRELDPGSDDKFSRAQATSVLWDNGRMWLPANGGQRFQDFKHELLVYPKSAWNDQVDNASYAGEAILREVGATGRCGYDKPARLRSKDDDDERRSLFG